MAKIIAVTNQKGGVGKTTTSINLAASLGETQRKVLLIDLDPQGNATTGSGVDANHLKNGACDVLMREANIEDTILKTQVGYDLLPSNNDLVAAEVALLKVTGRENRLKEALAKVKQNYDCILIDCPPAMGLLTLNALAAANSVIIPLQCEYYALEGLSGLIHTIQQLKQSVNPDLHIEGLLRTMYDSRNRLTIEVSEQLLKHFPDKVYRTVIPRNIRLAEAPSHGLPALHYDNRSPGAIAYLALAGEILRRDQSTVTQAS